MRKAEDLVESGRGAQGGSGLPSRKLYKLDKDLFSAVCAQRVDTRHGEPNET